MRALKPVQGACRVAGRERVDSLPTLGFGLGLVSMPNTATCLRTDTPPVEPGGERYALYSVLRLADAVYILGKVGVLATIFACASSAPLSKAGGTLISLIGNHSSGIRSLAAVLR